MDASTIQETVKGDAFAHLKQLVSLQLLCAEHNAVSITSDSDGLAALTDQHHVLPVFTVEPMGDACYCKHTKKKY